MKRILSLLSVLFLLVACGKKTLNSTDFDKEVYKPRYASGFKILGSEGCESVVIESYNPWQGADNVVKRLFVARGGEKVPDGFDGQVLKGNARRIVTMSSTHVAMLAAVERENCIVGASGLNYISNQYVQEHISSISDVGWGEHVDYELLLSLDPDLVLLYGINSASPLESKLKELSIPFLYVCDYLEESPVGKAEWLMTIAEVVGRHEAGEEAFKPIPEKYYALRDKVAKTPNLVKPKVMINTPFGGSWYMAPANSYVAQLIADAGGEYVYKQDTDNSSLAIDMEEAYRLTANSDKWINVGMVTTLHEIRESYPKFSDTKPLCTGEVYNSTARITPSGGNDYWETGLVQPHVVLHDLVKIFHPDMIKDDFVYYKKLQ